MAEPTTCLTRYITRAGNEGPSPSQPLYISPLDDRRLLDPVSPRDNRPARENRTDRDDQDRQTNDIRPVVRGSKHGRIDMGSDDTAPLRARIGQADAHARGDGAFKGADAFWPDHGIGTAGAGDGDDQCDVFDDRRVDRDQDDIAYDGGRFDCVERDVSVIF